MKLKKHVYFAHKLIDLSLSDKIAVKTYHYGGILHCLWQKNCIFFRIYLVFYRYFYGISLGTKVVY